MKNDIIQFLRGKSILILGYGREGHSALEFIQKNLPDAAVAVADINRIEIDGVLTFYGPDYLKHCKDFDVIIKSPGVAIKNDISDEDKEKVTSLTDLFLCFCQNPIIGITGTKGKSTTSSLVYHILNHCGKKALLTGNIGQPGFDIIDQLDYETIVGFELSCHQLEYVRTSPHVSILLNLYEEHLIITPSQRIISAPKRISIASRAAKISLSTETFSNMPLAKKLTRSIPKLSRFQASISTIVIFIPASLANITRMIFAQPFAPAKVLA